MSEGRRARCDRCGKTEATRRWGQPGDPLPAPIVDRSTLWYCAACDWNFEPEDDELSEREAVLVAAAYEVASRLSPVLLASTAAPTHIKSLTPAGAKATLDRMLAEAEERGRRELRNDYQARLDEEDAALKAARAAGVAEERERCARIVTEEHDRCERMHQDVRHGSALATEHAKGGRKAAEDILGRIRGG